MKIPLTITSDGSIGAEIVNAIFTHYLAGGVTEDRYRDATRECRRAVQELIPRWFGKRNNQVKIELDTETGECRIMELIP